jgi:hypothetical protein
MTPSHQPCLLSPEPGSKPSAALRELHMPNSGRRREPNASPANGSGPRPSKPAARHVAVRSRVSPFPPAPGANRTTAICRLLCRFRSSRLYFGAEANVRILEVAESWARWRPPEVGVLATPVCTAFPILERLPEAVSLGGCTGIRPTFAGTRVASMSGGSWIGATTGAPSSGAGG